MEHRIPAETIGTYEANVIEEIRKEKKKIYIADDDLSILFALDSMLQNAGYHVLLSHCGRPMLEDNLPATDLVILDSRVPRR